MLVICGPTAVGKTAYALEMAEKNGAEIISADSGQIYRGMDIGTAKPTLEEQALTFHLIDIINPNEIFSAADFRERALKAITEIQARGKQPLIVGGTGLYIKVLEEGLFEGPSRDPVLRQALEKEIQEKGTETLHAELQKIDPEAAKSIPAANRQRLIRALEVYRLTGKPISEFWGEHRRGRSPCLPEKGHPQGGAPTFRKIGLTLPKEELHQRIEKRIDTMVQQGLADEVSGLLKKWGRDSPGLKLIGYKEMVSYLEGEQSLEKAISLIKQNTRQYAKRQMTWFRRDKGIKWILS